MEGDEVVLLARSRRRRPRCPACQGSRVTVHSYYARALRDLPCWSRPVVLIVRLRRFRCRTGSCPQGLFVDRIPATAKPYARMTIRLSEAVRRFGYVLGGRPSAHLAGRLGVPLGADTILRRIKDPGRPSDLPATRVLASPDVREVGSPEETKPGRQITASLKQIPLSGFAILHEFAIDEGHQLRGTSLTIALMLSVRRDGSVDSIRPAGPPGGGQLVAVEAGPLSLLLFSPAMVNGCPAPTVITYSKTYNFK